ncbi:hypothetical protein NQZ68_025884 [Dissostichus eleginoides]|nr:hypothetical protein NQZ68_025884 [Dissostichus eleginoides]
MSETGGSVAALLTPPQRRPPANQCSHQPPGETIRGNRTTEQRDEGVPRMQQGPEKLWPSSVWSLSQVKPQTRDNGAN